MKTLVIGGGHVGRIIAERLDDIPVSVRFADPDSRVIARAAENGLLADETAITDGSELRARNIADASVVVVATESDSTNLLIAQLLRVRFGGPRIIVRVNDPQNRSAFVALGVETICSAAVLADALREYITIPRVERSISKRTPEQL